MEFLLGSAVRPLLSAFVGASSDLAVSVRPDPCHPRRADSGHRKQRFHTCKHAVLISQSGN